MYIASGEAPPNLALKVACRNLLAEAAPGERMGAKLPTYTSDRGLLIICTESTGRTLA